MSVHSSDEESGPEEFVDEEQDDSGNVQGLTDRVSALPLPLVWLVFQAGLTRFGSCVVVARLHFLLLSLLIHLSQLAVRTLWSAERAELDPCSVVSGVVYVTLRNAF
jgi:hypothetical protein